MWAGRLVDGPALDRSLWQQHYPAILWLTVAGGSGLALSVTGWRLLAGLVLTGFLAALAVFDACYGLLYDRLLVPLALLGLGLAAAGAGPGMAEGMEAAVLGAGFMLLLRILSRGGVGWGDVKYAGVLGLWLGLSSLLATLGVAFLSGGLAAVGMLLRGRGRRAYLPFGPFLSLGGYLGFLAGPELLALYGELL